MPAGQNGPYNDLETPVRNTSHWLLIFVKAYNLSQKDEFFAAASKCSNYLLNNEHVNERGIYVHRNKAGKDRCNGLIGPAWTIEALIEAYQAFRDTVYINRAVEYFNLHPFNERRRLWHPVDPSGRVLNVDNTFNHQLWFYMIAMMLETYDGLIEMPVSKMLNSFIRKYLGIDKSGRIFHPNWSAKNRLKRALISFKNPKGINDLIFKEIGYHSFNLYAFAQIYSINHEIDFYKSRAFSRIISYLSTKIYKDSIPQTKFSYRYNSPGYEIPVIMDRISTEIYETIPQIEHLIHHLNSHYDRSSKWFSIDNPDPNTLTARFYEITRLHNDYFNINFSLHD